MKLINLFAYCFISFFIAETGVCSHFLRASSASSKSDISQISLTDGIDIKALVKAQIDSAKARELRGEIKSFINYVSSRPSIIYTPNEPVDIETDSIFKILSNLRVQIIAGFSFLAFLIVFIRRIKNRLKDSTKKFPKENVELSIKEHHIMKNNHDLNLVRSQLVNLSASGISGDSVSEKAKNLNIAKGEVFLAAKIKSYQLAHLGSHSK